MLSISHYLLVCSFINSNSGVLLASIESRLSKPSSHPPTLASHTRSPLYFRLGYHWPSGLVRYFQCQDDPRQILCCFVSKFCSASPIPIELSTVSFERSNRSPLSNANSECAPQALISAWTGRGAGAPGIDREGTDWHDCRRRCHTGRQTQPQQAHRRTPLRWADCAVIGFKPGGGGCTVVGYIGSVPCVIPQSRQIRCLPRGLSAGPLRSGAPNARSSDD